MEAPMGDNSLPELAARIRAEHAAVGDAMKHAIVAGELLIEAKEKVARGDWLMWLKDNCRLSERTAQTYMRIARELGKLEPAKAQRVADLSVRDAVRQLASAAAMTQLTPQGVDQALATAEAAGSDVTLESAIRRQRRVERERDLLSSVSLTPPSSPSGRTIKVARNAAKRQWLLAIGPNAAGLTLEQDLEEADEDETIVPLNQEHNDIVDEAARLEAEAKALRAEAAELRRAIGLRKAAQVQARRGPAYALTLRTDVQRVHKPAKNKSGRLSSKANHTGGREPSGKCSFSENEENGTTQRLSTPSHRRQ